MQVLSILLDQTCPFINEISNYINEIGHNICTKDLFNQINSNTNYRIKRYNSKNSLESENTIYVSIYLNGNEYVISTLKMINEKLILLARTSFTNDLLDNGVDIYSRICKELKVAISDTFIILSNIINHSYKDILDINNDIPINAELDLESLKFWHLSNQTENKDIYIENLYQSFKNTVELLPNKCAIKFGNLSLSYYELFQESEKYSKSIRKYLNNNNNVVAIALPKGIELYAVILAVLKLEACYVPIDPEYPRERINNILTNAQPSLVIGDIDFQVDVNIASIKDLNKNSDVMEIEVPLSPNPNAVMIYTSGSTGSPKGVQLTHKNISHFCNWYIKETKVLSTSKCLQFTTISFDASLLDVFPTFITGATLIVPNYEQRHDFDKLDILVRHENISHCFIPAAMLSIIPQYEWPSIDHIITGGDVCDHVAIKYWAENTNLINIYGPTECTVLATYKKFSSSSNNKVIGKPIYNTNIYIVNKHGELCETFEHGELYISGPGVGPGYVNNTKQTEERFVKLEYSSLDNSMYRTGDICFWDDNGEINFVGRQDNQLKIRGFRVELGEIENTILKTGLYESCVVTSDTKKQIRAFVKGPASNITIENLQSRLREILPSYMLPTVIQEKLEFPLTINGKIDRKALANLDINIKVNQEKEIWTELQEELRNIWASSLDLDKSQISLKSSFFDLGGHSLLVSKMLLTVKNLFQGNFTLARFMENPTIEALSNLLTLTELTKGAQISDKIYADLVLDQSIQPLKFNNDYAFNPRSVFLTGATGFLGIHILEELIKNTNSTIFCLIRANSEEKALSKLRDNLKKFDIRSLESYLGSRIKIVCGDLAEPNLGLSCHNYKMLCESIDTIYHNGAQVNHIFDYEYLFNANVRSTLDLVKMACTDIQKQLIFVSTLSAASNLNADKYIVEEGPADELPAFVNNGYNLTKWVSEHLVWQAFQRGLPITLVRPGNITGHSHTGHCFPDQNRILLLLKGLVEMQSAPDWDLQFDICPVDFIAKGIVRCSLNNDLHTPVLHFHNPKPLTWKDYIHRLSHHGFNIKFIKDEEWRKSLLTIDESSALFPIVSFYLDQNSEDIGDISKISFNNTLNRLNLAGMDYPDKSNQLLDNGFKFLISSGFIDNNNTFELAPF